MVFTPLVGEHGAVDAVLATVVDITTQRQLEQQFTQAQKTQMGLVAVGFTLVCGEPSGNVSDPLEP